MAGNPDNQEPRILYRRYKGAHRRRLVLSVAGFVLFLVVASSWLELDRRE